MSSTETSSTAAWVAAIEYLISIITVRWMSTGRVKTLPAPSRAAEVNAPMHMLKIMSAPTVTPGRLRGKTTRRNTRARLDPWIWAASSSDCGMVRMTL